MNTKLPEDVKRPTPEEVVRALREGQEAVKRELTEVERQSLRRYCHHCGGLRGKIRYI